jgi:hypothetical protein
MMDRRAFLGALTAGTVAPLAAWARQAGRIYRIGYLGVTGRPADHPPFTYFSQPVTASPGIIGEVCSSPQPITRSPLCPWT